MKKYSRLFLNCCMLIVGIMMSSCGTMLPQATPAQSEPLPPTETLTQTATSSPTATMTPTSVPVGTLLLYQHGGGSVQLYLADLDQGTQTQLTDASYDVSSPGWTPDGWQIVYERYQADLSRIYIMDWNGENNQTVSSGDQEQLYPVVSPDGTRIAYFSRSPGHWALFVMGLDGSGAAAITDNTVFESLASWSPDSTSLAFTPWHNTESPPFIARVDADGQNYMELTDGINYENDPIWSPDGSKILYSCADNGVSQICSMLPDGSGKSQLTRSIGGNAMPVWSPDGSQIAFLSWRDSTDPENCEGGDCNYEIYVMNADGTNQIRLTNDPAEDWYPSWSPDGKQIAFVSLRDEPRHPADCGDTCNGEIYVMDVYGSNVTRVTNNSVPDWNPMWRPAVSGDAPASQTIPTSTPQAPIVGDDGNVEQVVYAAEDGNLYLLTLDGVDQVGVLLGEGESPSWSPDGSQIVFSRYCAAGGYELYIMDADGSNVHALTNTNCQAFWPDWSPDGIHIAYTSRAEEHETIHLINADGTDDHLLLSGDTGYYMPSWSPDGSRIAFLAETGDLYATIYLANADGSQVKFFEEYADWSSPLAWSLDGKSVVYGCYQDTWQLCAQTLGKDTVRPLTSLSQNGAPAYSSDGQRIAFVSYRDDNWEVYVMDASGQNQLRITNDWDSDFSPVFRP